MSEQPKSILAEHYGLEEEYEGKRDEYCDCVSEVNGPEEDCPNCDGTGEAQ